MRHEIEIRLYLYQASSQLTSFENIYKGMCTFIIIGCELSLSCAMFIFIYIMRKVQEKNGTEYLIFGLQIKTFPLVWNISRENKILLGNTISTFLQNNTFIKIK